MQCDVRPLPKNEIHKVIKLIKRFADRGNIDIKETYWLRRDWSFYL